MARHSTGYDYVPDGAAVERAVAEGELKFAAAGPTTGTYTRKRRACSM